MGLASGQQPRMDIKALRDRLGASQEDLANGLHVDVRTIRRWESGSVNPSPMAVAHLQQLRARQQKTDEGLRQDGRGLSELSEYEPTGSALPRRRMPVL